MSGGWVPVFALGAVPLLVWGFFASAAANRPLFAAWGLVSASAWAAVLRLGLTRRWSPQRRAASLCCTAGLAAAALSVLLRRWGGDLELGLTAVAPALPRGPLSSPWTAVGLAAGLLLVGGMILVAQRRAMGKEETR